MTSTDLAVHKRELTPVVLDNEQLRYIANTDFVPKPIRGNLPAILATVAAGRAVGIDDMSALRTIHIVDGKPTFAAELMVMLVRRAGHSITGSVGEGQATVKGKRADNGDEMEVVWTLEMAKRANLANKNNWKQYPEAMLWARAVSQLCRMLFADCFIGGTYTAEELGDDSLSEDGDGEGSHRYTDGSEPDRKAGLPPSSESEPVDSIISADQVKRLWTVARGKGLSDAWVHDIVWRRAHVDSTKAVPRDRYDAVIQAILETDDIPFEDASGEADSGADTPADGTASPDAATDSGEVDALRDRLLELAGELDALEATQLAIARNRVLAAEDLAAHKEWLERCIASAEQNVKDRAARDSESLFEIPEKAR